MSAAFTSRFLCARGNPAKKGGLFCLLNQVLILQNFSKFALLIFLILLIPGPYFPTIFAIQSTRCLSTRTSIWLLRFALLFLQSQLPSLNSLKQGTDSAIIIFQLFPFANCFLLKNCLFNFQASYFLIAVA